MAVALASSKWTTASVNALLENHKKTGVIPVSHPFYNRKLGKRKADLVFGYTKEELIELIKCEDDVIYFANNYCKILTKFGRKIIGAVGGLRPYQEKMLRQYQDNKYNITLASRQIGKSITVAIYVCWYILFNKDANILLLSETGQKAKDLLTKIKEIQDNLPFFMQKGLQYSSTQRRMYDNGCTLISENTTENTGVSGSYTFVYWDEMALLDEKMQDSIFTGLFPTMASFGDQAKFIITSTPRGRNNKFYKIWAGATAEKNSPKYLPFAFSRIFWYENPDNDEEWAKNEKVIMGEAGFAREYDLSFDADEDLLVSDIVKRMISGDSQTYVKASSEYPNSLLRIKKDYDISFFSDIERRFHISIDLASGKGAKGDYTVFNIFEIVQKTDEETQRAEFFEDEGDFFKQVQVGIIRTNKYSPEEMAKMLHDMLVQTFEAEHVRLTVEMNHKGGEFVNNIFTYKGNKNELKDLRDELVVSYPAHLNFANENARYDEGIMQTEKSKKETTDNINTRIENGDVEITEAITIDEGLSFGRTKNGKFAGLGEHDDCFMTVLNASIFRKTEDYYDFVDELYSMLYPDEKYLIEKMLGKDEEYGEDSHDIY